MTITIQPARNEYTATQSQTVFNYTFKIYTESDLNVYVTPAGQEANDSTDIVAGYSVSNIGSEDGGSIVLVTPANENDLVTIVSNIPFNRTIDYQFNGDFDPDTVNNDFDRSVSLAKQVEDLSKRTFVFEQSQQGILGLGIGQPIANYYLRWDATAKRLISTQGTVEEDFLPILEGLVDDAEQAAASSANSAQESSNCRLLSYLWANEEEDVEVEPGEFSSFHWAKKSEEFANTINPSDYVAVTGDQTIAGIKTFTSSPVVPTPTTDFQAATKKYVDDAVAGVSISGTATFTNSTNNIALVGLGALSGLEVGDVIQVSGSASNDTEFTVEVITDNDNVIVNQAHAGGTSSKSLVNETVAVTITLLSKWYVAPIGLGQGIVNVTSSRTDGVNYQNLTNRTIQVTVQLTSNAAANASMTVDGESIVVGADGGNAEINAVTSLVCKDIVYSATASLSIGKWLEIR